MKGTVVYVRWVDSTSRTGWQYLPDFRRDRRDALLCVTIGFLVREDEETISVSATLAFHDGPGVEADGVHGPMTIPRCAILDMWEIGGVH